MDAEDPDNDESFQRRTKRKCVRSSISTARRFGSMLFIQLACIR
jgi:hypothetical protein